MCLTVYSKLADLAKSYFCDYDYISKKLDNQAAFCKINNLEIYNLLVFTLIQRPAGLLLISFLLDDRYISDIIVILLTKAVESTYDLS